MTNDLQLLSGIDIPFIEAQLIIHQPTLKEIAYIGEESFFIGCELLNFSKDGLLKEEDKTNLEDKTNFDVLMSILKDKKNAAARTHSVYATMVLSLMFPEYKILVMKDHIGFFKEGEDEKVINNKNYEVFKEILSDMFCLKKVSNQNLSYNPGGDKAKEIAEKLKKGREKAAAAKGEEQGKIFILSRYISILTIGQHKNFDSLLNYTVYQLFDEFHRFELKQNYDVYFKAKLAGAKDIEEVDNWMKDIHS